MQNSFAKHIDHIYPLQKDMCFFMLIHFWKDGPKFRAVFVLFMFRYLGGSWWDMLVDVLLCFPRQFVVPPCWFGKPAPSSGPLGPDGKPDCRGWLVLGCGVKFLNCNYSVVEVKLYTVS